MAKNYKELSVFSFGNRTKKDQEQAKQRITVPKGSYELEAINRPTTELGENPFSVDSNIINQHPYFRKLSSMGQLAPSASPHFQNRANHTNHVERIVERMCLIMGLDKESISLSKAIANIHDIGHGPFSHTSEEVYDKKLKAYGAKWDHDNFGLELALKFANHGQTYSGLPLTAATIEGFAKRFRKYTDDATTIGYFNKNINDLSEKVQNLEKERGSLHLNKWNGIEGQIAATADWVSITVSDIRDLLLMTMNKTAANKPLPSELREAVGKTFDDIAKNFPIAGEIWKGMETTIKEKSKKRHEIKNQDYVSKMEAVIISFSNELENTLIKDVLDNTLENYKNNKSKINFAGDIRKLDNLLVTPGRETRKQLRNFDTHMRDNIYPKLNSEYINTHELMDKFYELVKDGFEKPDSKLSVGKSWKDHYNNLSKQITDEIKLEIEKVKAIATYININYSERDVIWNVKKHDHQYAEEKIKYERLAPTQMPPEPTITSLQIITKIMKERTDQQLH